LADEIAKNDTINMTETGYYKEWVNRKGGIWSEDKIKEFVNGKMELMLDVKTNGLREPLLVKQFGQICDGGHRLAILRALGHKTVPVRIV